MEALLQDTTAKATDPASRRLGQDLRSLRKARSFTLAELALKLGRSVGWLSQVERGLSQPGISDLRALSNVLDVPLGFFFANETAPPEEQGFIVRRDARRSLGNTQDGLVEELLSPDLGGSFEIVRSVFAPGSVIKEPANRPTEEAGYVVAGTLELTLGDRRFQLLEGDSFRFKDQILLWRNPGDKPCIVIWVIAPPLY